MSLASSTDDISSLICFIHDVRSWTRVLKLAKSIGELHGFLQLSPGKENPRTTLEDCYSAGIIFLCLHQSINQVLPSQWFSSLMIKVRISEQRKERMESENNF